MRTLSQRHLATMEEVRMLSKSGMRFAVSEFDSPEILHFARDFGLRVHRIGERRNIGNRRTELLITNYEPRLIQTSFFDTRIEQGGAYADECRN